MRLFQRLNPFIVYLKIKNDKKITELLTFQIFGIFRCAYNLLYHVLRREMIFDKLFPHQTHFGTYARIIKKKLNGRPKVTNTAG